MDETMLKMLQLHQGTIFNPPTSLLCSCNHRHSASMYRRFFKWTIFPTVHADEGISGEGKPMLEIKKPALFVTDQEIQDKVSMETGAGRVKAIFQKDYLDQYHPDFLTAFGVAKAAGFCTFIFMSVLGSIQGREEFIKKHQHVKFKTKFRAVRAYRDAILFTGIKVGGIYALKIGLFTFSFFMSSTIMSAYFNRTSPLDFAFGGGVTGSLFKFNLGPKGMVGGGVIGAVFGGVAGLVISGALNASGETYDLLHNQRIHDELLHEKEALLISRDELTKEEISTLHIRV